MHQRDGVRLSDEERGVCQALLTHLQGASQTLRRAPILRKADVAGPGWSAAQMAEAFHCRVHTIAPLRKRLAPASFARALEGKQRAEPPRPCQRDGAGAAPRIALRLGQPPAGDGHGTGRRRADDMVAWAVGDAISPERGRTTRKKTA